MSSLIFLRVASLQNEVGTKDFFRVTNFLTKNAPKFSQKFLSLYFVGPKKSPAKFPPSFPQNFPPPNFFFKIQLRASAGAQKQSEEFAADISPRTIAPEISVVRTSSLGELLAT